jgi:hypothetical protein
VIGFNTLKLNKPTMRAALEMYLESIRAPSAPKQQVTEIEQDRSDDTFEVSISSVEPKAVEQQ